MTDLKFAILGFLYHSPNHENDETALFNNHFGTVDDVFAALEDMMRTNHPLIVKPIGKNTLKLTSAGRTAFENAQEERNQDAEKKRQQRFDNKISVASVLIPSITFVIGILVEHYTDLVNLLISAFK